MELGGETEFEGNQATGTGGGLALLAGAQATFGDKTSCTNNAANEAGAISVGAGAKIETSGGSYNFSSNNATAAGVISFVPLGRAFTPQDVLHLT